MVVDMTTPIAIWDWEREPQPPSARVVVCRAGLMALHQRGAADAVFAAMDEAHKRGVTFIVCGDDAELVHAFTSRLIPALYAERRADIAGVGALLAVRADRRALVLCPREALALSDEVLRGRFIECPDETQDPETDPCRGCRGYTNEGGDHCGAVRGLGIDLVVIIPPPEARTCESCAGLGHPSEEEHGDFFAHAFYCGACNGSGRIEPWALHPVWVRGIVEQCREAGVPVVFLGWGRWLPWSQRPMDMALTREMLIRDGNAVDLGGEYAWPVGEERSGRLLGGAEVMELPEWLT